MAEITFTDLKDMRMAMCSEHLARNEKAWILSHVDFAHSINDSPFEVLAIGTATGSVFRYVYTPFCRRPDRVIGMTAQYDFGGFETFRQTWCRCVGEDLVGILPEFSDNSLELAMYDDRPVFALTDPAVLSTYVTTHQFARNHVIKDFVANREKVIEFCDNDYPIRSGLIHVTISLDRVLDAANAFMRELENYRVPFIRTRAPIQSY